MYRLYTLRFVAFSSLAFLFHSASATADCIKPEWKDMLSVKHLDYVAITPYVMEFQSRVHEYIVCQRNSLEKRASGLAPPDVRQLVLRDRETEDRAIAELSQLGSCLSAAERELDPAVAHEKCEDFFKRALEERRPEDTAYAGLKGEQRNEYGGVWGFRTLDLGRQGSCHHGPCSNLFAVEVTNTTPVALRCKVALTVSNPQDGTDRREQAIKLYPGDSLPAARVLIRGSPEVIEPAVMCSPETSLVPELRVPAVCVLKWRPRESEFPRVLSYPKWESGAALVEFAVQQGHKPPETMIFLHADSSSISNAARAEIERNYFSTNCAGQHFRIRVEYRAFPCYVCSFEAGVVTLLRDDRRVP